MIAASSFNGINGCVWGYHLAKADAIADGSLSPIVRKQRHDGAEIPVWPVEPLLDAGQRLFGTDDARRFPIIPGGHVICAAKDVTVPGPTSVWCAIAIAIAEDRDTNANLFIEDVGHSIPAEDSSDREAHLDRLMENIAESVILCGEDQNVLYREIFVGYKTEWIPEGYVGCALTCAPYVVLAKNAVPSGGPPSRMLDMTITEWENAVGF
jgi:histidine decarboxylase